MSHRIDSNQPRFSNDIDALGAPGGADDGYQTLGKPGEIGADELSKGQDISSTKDGLLEQLEEVAEGFWSEVSGSTARAAQELDNIADQAVDELKNRVKEKVFEPADEYLDDFRADLGEALEQMRRLSEDIEADALDSFDELIPGSRALIERSVEADEKYMESMVEFAASKPQDQVAEAAARALNGQWDLAAEVALNVLRRGATPAAKNMLEKLDIALEGARIVEEKKDSAIDEILDRTAQIASDFVLEKGELIEGLGALVEDIVDNPTMNIVNRLQYFTPIGWPLRAARGAVLALAESAQDAPALSESIRVIPDKLDLLFGRLNSKKLADRLEQLPIDGPALREKSALLLEGFSGAGGGVGGSIQVDARRSGEERFEVRVQLDGELNAGLGLGAQDEGIRAVVAQQGGAEITVEFSGADANQNAARLLSLGAQNSLGLHDLKELLGADAKVLSYVGGHGGGIAASAARLKLDGHQRVEATFKLVEEERYVGLQGKSHISLGYEGSFIQHNNPLSQAWMDDPAPDFPGAAIIFRRLPSGLLKDIKTLYGPRAGLSLKGGAELTAALLTPADKREPIRLELDVDVPMRFGSTDGSANYKLVISDLGELARAADMSAEALGQKLSTGELSVQDLGIPADQLSSLVESDGPTLTVERSSAMSALKVLGVERGSGEVESFEVAKYPDNMDFLKNMNTILSADPKNTDAPAEARLAQDIRQQQLAAHSARLS